MDMTNRAVMIRPDTQWENFDSPYKRKNAFCRIAFIFGLIFFYGGAALIVIGWLKDKHLDSPYVCKMAGYVVLVLGGAVFALFMMLSCCARHVCLSCDDTDEKAQRYIVTVMPRKGPVTNKVSPLEWGERDRFGKNQIVPMQCTQRALDGRDKCVPALGMDGRNLSSSSRSNSSAHNKEYGGLWRTPRTPSRNKILPEKCTESTHDYASRGPVSSVTDGEIATIHLPPESRPTSSTYKHIRGTHRSVPPNIGTYDHTSC